MTRYTHPDLAGFLSPAAFTLDGIQYPRVWWKTVDAQDIIALGFVEYVPPEPEPVPPSPPVPSIVASGVFTISNGWIEAVGAASGIGMAFPIDVGIYWLFFSDAQPDLSYATYVSASSGQINISSRSTDYVELCVTDGGVPVDPSEFSINIVRSK
ncbi:hypothetical protein [Mesorhizobium sp. CAU 1741]|uniref:hypothetical protein n=1 Tax=Mesorhizobium sp. CAU 1741 TaxID=3140366 RepID=UPI00325AC8B0